MTSLTTSPVATEPPPTDTPSRRRWPVRDGLALPGLVIAVTVFFCVLPATSATFATSANLGIILGTQAVLVVAAMGVLIPLVAGEYDLSVGATLCLSAVVSATAFSHGAPIWFAAVLAVLVGALVGLVNGLLVTVIGVDSLISTLATSTILAGVVQQITHGSAVINNIPSSLITLGSGKTLGIPNLAYVVAVLAILTHYLLAHTPLGRHLTALGSNREAAALVGLNTRRGVGLAFVASGVLAGLAGLLQLAHTGTGDPNIATAFTLTSFVPAILSAAAIWPGRFNVPGTIVAVLFLAVLNSGLNLLGAATYLNSYINGLALIIGVALAAYLGRRSQSQR